MQQKDEVRALQLQELRSRMDKGLAEAESGEGTDGDEYMRQMIDELDTGRAQR